MRWLTARRPCTGEERERSKFLWLPKTINLETRWLERAVCLERLCSFGAHRSWIAQHWIDEPRYTITEAGRKALEERK